MTDHEPKKTYLDCPCGVEIFAEGTDELVEKAQAHLQADHAGREYTREQILMMAR